MELFNIGPLELIVIVVFMFVLLGPKEMILTAYKIGKYIRGIVRSPMWREILNYSQEIRELPQKLMEDTGLDDTLAEVKKSTQEAANEINSQIKEVADAARVPEAEHVRIDTSTPQPAIAPPQPEPSVTEVEYVPSGVLPGAFTAVPKVKAPEPVAPPQTVVEQAVTPEPSTPAIPESAPAAASAVSANDGMLVGIPMMPVRKPKLNNIEPALRPRSLRPAESAPAVAGGAAAASVAESADGAAFGSFAPRPRRFQMMESVAVPADAVPANGHNGKNGSEHQPAAAASETGVHAQVEETEPRDAVQ